MFTFKYYWSETIFGASDKGRKINVWSTYKFSKGLHTAVSIAFSVQNKNSFYFALKKVRWMLPKQQDAMNKNNCEIEKKINVWSTNKFSKGLHTAVSIAFSVQNKNSFYFALKKVRWMLPKQQMQSFWKFIGAPNVEFFPFI